MLTSTLTKELTAPLNVSLQGGGDEPPLVAEVRITAVGDTRITATGDRRITAGV